MCTIRKKSGSKPGQKVTKLSLFALNAGIFCQNWKKNRLLLKMGVFLCNQPNRPLKTAVKPPKIPLSAPENRLFSEFSKNYYAYLRIILIFRRNFHFFCCRGRQNCRPIAVAFPFQFVESRPASPKNRHPQTTATPRRRVSAAPRRFPLCCGGFLRRSCLSARKCARFCLSGKETIAAGECQSRRHKIKSPGRCTHLPGDFVVL